VSSLQLPLAEPLSPELVLVCPELAERARSLLPDPGWLAAAVRAGGASSPRLSRLQTLALVSFCLLTTLTPLIWTVFALPHHAPS
jgi:hypothetical protein